MDQHIVERAIKIKDAHHRTLLGKPNVVGTDVGFKYVGGKRTDQVAIRVFVNKKEDVPPADAIPKTLDGMPTDVIVRGKIVLQVARKPAQAPGLQVETSRNDTLIGGLSIGPCREAWGDVFAGTQGAIVQKGDDAYFALSNFHVMFIDGTGNVGDQIAQPSRVDHGSCPHDLIGTITQGCLATKFNCNNKQVDAALCTVNRAVSNTIKGIGLVAGSAPPVLGSAVRKQGRTTELTFGTIDGVDAVIGPIEYGAEIGALTLTGQITIAPELARNARFSDHGDSGSVIVDPQNRVVGLLFAGMDDGSATFANVFSDVEQALGIKLFTTLPKGVYLFEYKIDAGTVAIDHVRNDAHGTTEMWRDHWTTGWTSVEPFTFANRRYLFEYKSGDGTVAIDELGTTVAGSAEKWRGHWTQGWTTIKPFSIENNVFLFEYKTGDGTVAIDQINSRLQGTTEIWRSSWSQGWTTIEPFVMGRKQYLFEYKAGDGTVAIDEVAGDAHGTTERWRGSWSTGWTSVKPFLMGGQVHLFEYKLGDGTVAIDRVNANVQGTTELWRGSWTTGWTSIEPFTIGGNVFLIEYKIGDATVAIDRINANLQGSTEVWRGQWTTGWTVVKPAFSIG